MCGITGLWHLNPQGHNPETSMRITRNMLRQIIYRGPDHQAIWKHEKQGMYIGHARLKIIDTSDAGNQPIRSQCGRYIMAYNGEIYNYKELKEQLKDDWVFISETDTEVILAAYHKWGEKCFEKLDGMWAIALYDIEAERLFLSRDKFGEKPLFFYNDSDNETIVFASEIKAILETKVLQFEPDLESVANFVFL